jgi:hypothetical protein
VNTPARAAKSSESSFHALPYLQALDLPFPVTGSTIHFHQTIDWLSIYSKSKKKNEPIHQLMRLHAPSSVSVARPMRARTTISPICYIRVSLQTTTHTIAFGVVRSPIVGHYSLLLTSADPKKKIIIINK